MKEKLVLELLVAGRLSIEESAALLGLSHELPNNPTGPKIRKRHKVAQRSYSNADHLKIIDTYLTNHRDVKRTATICGMNVTSVRNHIQYAGLVPVPSEAQAERVLIWRRNRKMYAHLGLPVVSR